MNHSHSPSPQPHASHRCHPEPAFARIAKFARAQGVHVSTIYRNRDSYPKIHKLGGIAIMWNWEIELWRNRER